MFIPYLSHKHKDKLLDILNLFQTRIRISQAPMLCNKINYGYLCPARTSPGHEPLSLRKVSYKAFVFSVFSRNQEKTKPLTWRRWRSVNSEALQ